MSPVLFDRERITQWLGEHTVAKSRSVGPVTGVTWRGDTLTGDVQGSERQPYQTLVRFRTDGGSPWAQGSCSCPVGYNCKHVAALLFAELAYHDEMDHIIHAESGDDSAQLGRHDDSEQSNGSNGSDGGVGAFRQQTPAAGVRPELVSWLERFRASAEAAETRAQKDGAVRTQTLAYLLNWSRFQLRHEVSLYRATCRADGTISQIGEPWGNVEGALLKQPRFVSDEDLSILRGLWLGRSRDDFDRFILRGSSGAEILQKLIVTGRLFFEFKPASGKTAPTPLALAAERPGRIEWEPLADQRLRPVLRTDPRASMVLPTEPIWYVDGEANEAGVVATSLPFQQLPDYLAMPPISLAEAPLVASVLREIAPGLPPPPSHDSAVIRVIDMEPVPVLVLNSYPLPSAGRGVQRKTEALELAAVSFDYDGVSINVDSSVTLVPMPGGDVIHIRRRYDTEKKRLLELRKAGLQKVPTSRLYMSRLPPGTMLGLPDGDAEAWSAFVNDALPALVAQGWRVTMAAEFRYNVIEIDAIEGAAYQAGDGWFDLEMGIRIGERKVRLEPLLADLFRRDRRWLGGALESIADSEPIELKTEENKRLRLRADRLKPVVRVLVDLFDALGGTLADGALLRVPSTDAGRLAALDDTGRWQFRGEDAIRQMARRLQAGPGLREVPVPRGLHAQLRVYQQQGLDWMQFLREHGLAGVLADDMGLGKTVQTLAHILAEKEAGRLTRPALIVVPTTLVHNWREEARRFAPDLKVLVLDGPQRKERFEQIGAHELVLTTYALLWRDQKVLAEHDYHLLILDEAQYVKNATTKAAQAIRGLRARHRLCLTGTPLENHLGELWSQFDFLLPGFLGTQKDFTRRWRNPIEKNGDDVRRSLLARRIRPFMLRRRKDEVAKELPPKTTIVCSVELEGAQRDLYETVRTAMQEKVRAAITAQGLARSHIIVLDALLKLRQVCCDPRLVKKIHRPDQAADEPETVPAARPPAKAGKADKAAKALKADGTAPGPGSAKLDLLLSMLPELIDEGRRVLLFSQFTGMLALIAGALEEAAIPYVLLTGDTADRVTPVERFQRGEVPLFLISLKAGGVGLNLTAADTVIHYDPWWNPAAENQATDRAHRLGQDKPVFVYKLIAAGSIEEKIVELQEQKAGLADSILSEDAAGAARFSDDDLAALFAPMPAIESGR
ncbi:DEAD/DEAH box helicase [Paraburkholderia sp. BCC1886]|uniref:DEAD/DEAH box helicase n=1 Tax=Paraburkholderia sp. BCC1886 TaxID=2562670 RepID=UPI00118441A5|nr:DEAD/DEAH box helicase [Paraburkholderia sp. BCC1886]